jgi:hypothetical protein
MEEKSIYLSTKRYMDVNFCALFQTHQGILTVLQSRGNGSYKGAHWFQNDFWNREGNLFLTILTVRALPPAK